MFYTRTQTNVVHNTWKMLHVFLPLVPVIWGVMWTYHTMYTHPPIVIQII